jgi:hypothetical protein
MTDKTIGELTVRLATEHEDGSATFEIDAPKEVMQQLFESMFTQAVIRGIETTKKENDAWVCTTNVVKAAKELDTLLRMWEVSDTLDYEPEVRQAREKLTEALRAHSND